MHFGSEAGLCMVVSTGLNRSPAEVTAINTPLSWMWTESISEPSTSILFFDWHPSILVRPGRIFTGSGRNAIGRQGAPFVSSGCRRRDSNPHV